MILRNATIQYKGYDPDKLSKGSHKRICVSCDICGRVRYVSMYAYRDLCESCVNKGKNNHNYKNKIIKICEICGNEFGVIPSKKNQRVCSKACRYIEHSKLMISNNSIKKLKINLLCKYCNKEYQVIQSLQNKSIFCSKKCYSEWCSKYRIGENSFTWKSNITDKERIIQRKYPEYTKWRKDIFKRDNYICQYCNQYGGNLNAHHIESYNNNSELRTTLDNGITLCKKCHDDFHHIYGRGNNTKEQFNEFMENK